MDKNSELEIARKWLEDPDNLGLLRSIAGSIYAGYRNRPLLRLLPGTDLESEPEADEILAMIQSELALMVLEKASLQELLAVDESSIAQILKTAFINQYRDRRRNSLQSPRHKLYRSAMATLRHCDRFFTQSPTKGYVVFSKFDQNRLTPPLTEEDLTSIELPEAMAALTDFKAVNRKGALLELADHFWEEVSRMFSGVRIWINGWDFINWIFEMYRFDEHLLMGLDDMESTPLALETGKGPQADALYFDAAKIENWAHMAAVDLNDREQALIYLRYAKDYSLAQIADILGYSSPSGPIYRLENAEEKLRNFLRDKDWLCPDDPNPEAQALFFTVLFSILKKSPAMPSDITGNT